MSWAAESAKVVTLLNFCEGDFRPALSGYTAAKNESPRLTSFMLDPEADPRAMARLIEPAAPDGRRLAGCPGVLPAGGQLRLCVSLAYNQYSAFPRARKIQVVTENASEE